MSTRLMRVGLSIAVSVLTVLSIVGSGDAHHAVLRFNLEEMTRTADRIFVGRCVAVEETEEMIAQGLMPVTLYTFEVERAVKGRVPKQLTFRQLGHPARRSLGKGGEVVSHGRAIGPDTFLHGMSEYRVGDRMILFLIPDYLGGKVTYPVGLYQGAFYVSDMPSGESLARNGINNLGLFSAPYNGTTMKEADAKLIFPSRAETVQDAAGELLARKRGALPLEGFLELVDSIVSAHGDRRGVIIGLQKGAIQQ